GLGFLALGQTLPSTVLDRLSQVGKRVGGVFLIFPGLKLRQPLMNRLAQGCCLFVTFFQQPQSLTDNLTGGFVHAAFPFLLHQSFKFRGQRYVHDRPFQITPSLLQGMPKSVKIGYSTMGAARRCERTDTTRNNSSSVGRLL